MWLVLVAYQLATLLLARAQNACIGHSTFRRPANSDIQVVCGHQTVNLQILLCPIYFNGYNESLLSLNSEHTIQLCKGTADWAVDPPVVRFNFSITEEGISACSSTLTVTQESGTGLFSDFSHVEYINIAGMVCSEDPTKGAITYHQEVMYRFSCRYPLQYLVNNTQMSVSGVSLAVKDTNGSFVSTLSMGLFMDNSYSSMLQIPFGGLELKTRIFVEVRASNLSNRFNVLLDRCYATSSPFNVKDTFHDLFVGCDLDVQTVIANNGKQQDARFSFEAFRFVQSKETLSTYYVHCATRLCLKSFCPSLTQNCTSGTNSRRRRSVSKNQDTIVSDSATITSGPITTRIDNGNMLGSGGTQQTHENNTVVVVSVIAGTVGVICLTLVAFVVYQMHKSNAISNKLVLCSKE